MSAIIPLTQPMLRSRMHHHRGKLIRQSPALLRAKSLIIVRLASYPTCLACCACCAGSVQTFASGQQDPQSSGGNRLGDWLAGTLRSNQANQELEARQREISASRSVLSEDDIEDRKYGWWWLLPLQPFSLRKTLREEVVPGQIWSFEQPHGAINIVVNLRMTVVRLEGGGLWVHSPIAPTRECIRLLWELESRHGKVKHIVLPTYAVEHKVFLGPFARACPEAEIWAVPGQWSWPINLPTGWLGVFPRRVNVIGQDEASWQSEFKFTVLSTPLQSIAGDLVEGIFFHKASSTLIVTDLLVCVPEAPPAVCLDDPTPILLMQRDTPNAEVREDEEGRQSGWMKTALLALYLRPDAVQIEPDGGFAWQEGWRDAFASVAGRVIVPPILRKLVLNRIPEQVQSRVAEIAEWDIQYVMAAHFSARVPFTSVELIEAFAFLEGSIPEDYDDGMNEASSSAMRETGEDQCSLLNQIDTFLVEKGLAASNNISKETAP